MTPEASPPSPAPADAAPRRGRPPASALARAGPRPPPPVSKLPTRPPLKRRMEGLSPRQRQVLELIDESIRSRGYPPSVREIGEAVGLSSPSTVHSHLAALEDKGFLRRDPTKPRAIDLVYEPMSGAPVERATVRYVPLVGDVAAGTGVLAAEQIQESLPLPEDFTGGGDLFMVKVRGESMIEAGIFDGD